MFEARLARKGATLLDKKYPDWHHKIDLDKFNMKLDGECVLSQLYDGYVKGYNLVFREAKSAKAASRLAARHGYVTGFAFPFTSYGNLTSEWRRIIILRLDKEEVDS